MQINQGEEALKQFK